MALAGQKPKMSTIIWHLQGYKNTKTHNLII